MMESKKGAAPLVAIFSLVITLLFLVGVYMIVWAARDFMISNWSLSISEQFAWGAIILIAVMVIVRFKPHRFIIG